MWTTLDNVALIFFIITMAASYQFKFSLTTWLLVFVYGLALSLVRLVRFIWQWVLSFAPDKSEPAAARPIRNGPPKNITEYPAYYHLSGMKAVQGFGSRGQIIKEDFQKGHTLISGATGGGKTFNLHNLLVQWYSQGTRFTQKYAVFLIDLKGNEKDYLIQWKPVVDRYADLSDALEALEEVERYVHSGHPKHLIVIIDEVANLTRFSGDKKGAELLEKLAGQLRVSGTLIAATQYARYDVVGTLARFNFMRRICFKVVELEHARAALSNKSIKDKDLPKSERDFIMIDHDGYLRHGKAPLVSAWRIIGKVIGRYQTEIAESDIRLKLFRSVAGDLKVKAPIIGIRNLGTFEDMKYQDIMFAYRNYAQAEAFYKGKQNKYYLACDFPQAFKLVQDWIGEEKWQNEPGKSR